MPHFVETHMSDLSGYIRFGQAFPESPNPAIHQRVIGVEDFSQHPEGAFAHGVKQDTQCFLGSYFLVRAPIALSKITPAYFASIALFAGRNAVFNHLLSGTVLIPFSNQNCVLQF